jgi:serine/threonine-protein kinase
MKAMASGPTAERGQSQPFGPFLLERRIAVGGSAEVFLARPASGDLPAPRLVVKRLLRGERGASALGLLETEARLHRAVEHPNVVTVFGAGMVGDEPYLAMEYVEGVDLYRLLRRAEVEERAIPPGVAVHIARRVADALAAVHEARDSDGNDLHIVHRDVTPSNVYLSVDGDVKLGDFGIARVKRGKTTHPTAGLKGKFGYLSPEQVAGEAFDHRADLFSLAVVLGEVLIGERVFPGSGQLAVLLAIRDVDITPLRRKADALPPGLFALLERGLARAPSDRFQNAAELCEALAAFEQPSAAELRAELAGWVRWAHDSSQLARRIEGQIRESVGRLKAVRVAGPLAASEAEPPDAAAAAAFVPNASSCARKVDGTRLDDLPFSKLIELVATGELGADDEVALFGGAFRKIREVEEIARHLLPSTSATTGRLFQPGAPDYEADLATDSMLAVLAHMRIHQETGALFVERREQGALLRKEVYLENGRLLHVASSDPHELLGQYLLRRGRLTRQQLDTALTMLSSYGGRLGDTLIGMAMVEAMDVFRAIRDQGRDRVAAICSWGRGRLSFYRGTHPARVEFPLDLDLAIAMMAGAIARTRGKPRSSLPQGETRVRPGPRAHLLADPVERGTIPSSLQLVIDHVAEQLTVEELLFALTAPRPAAATRPISQNEACAALVTAQHLDWIAL